MNSIKIFKAALGIDTPWEVTKINFGQSEGKHELHINVNFRRSTKFKDTSGKECCVHDSKMKTWRHLNFFQHACYIHCRTPRIKDDNGKVSTVNVPWARSGSGFTLLFESYVMALIESEMPVNKVGRLVNENPHRIWTIFNYWIERAIKSDDASSLKKLGIDETSRKKGHNYLTVAVDIEERRVIHITEGKDKASVKAVKEGLTAKGVDVKKVKHASMDMSPSYISGVNKYFPEAEIHFDRFHVVKLLNHAMDILRQQERKEHQELKGHKYTFLKNPENLSAHKKKELSGATGMVDF